MFEMYVAVHMLLEWYNNHVWYMYIHMLLVWYNNHV